MTFPEILSLQKAFFASHTTKDISFRLRELKKFRSVLRENEEVFSQAIYDDYGKSPYENYLTELALTYQELDQAIKNLKDWSRPVRVKTGWANFPAKSYYVAEPLGNSLVIGAWNYPIQLSLLPAVSALAAGNTVIIKPSERTPKTSAAMARIFNQNFDPRVLYVNEAGPQGTEEMLTHSFDKVFFTGGTETGRKVYQAAAKNLTPVTLELGGKSPAFVMADCNLKITARRLVWAKFLNAGQTCIAPDYLLVEDSIYERLMDALVKEIHRFHGHEQLAENYCRIIDEEHFDRLIGLIDPEKLLYGGKHNRTDRYIQPTVLRDVTFSDTVMQDEIFGPILPVVRMKNLDWGIEQVNQLPRPLACYVYSKNKKSVKRVLGEISFGGGAVNESVTHIANAHLPFGGVGYSGLGNYHGKFGFDTFSYFKSIIDKKTWYETHLKYPPYNKMKERLARWLLG